MNCATPVTSSYFALFVLQWHLAMKMKRCGSIYVKSCTKISICVKPYKLGQDVTFLGKLIARNLTQNSMSCTMLKDYLTYC